MLSDDAPVHSTSGEFRFKYAEEDTRSQVVEQVKEVLYNEYDIELSIDETGLIHNKETDIPHIIKILEDKFGYIANLFEDRRIHHQVQFVQDKSVDYELLIKNGSIVISELDAINKKLWSKKNGNAEITYRTD